MKKHIELKKKKVQYTLRKSRRARRLRVAVSCAGVVVSAPRSMSENLIECFLLEKSAWLLEKLAYFRTLTPMRGGERTKADFVRHKEQAQLLAESRIAHFNAGYGFTYQHITIRNQKTRWGSCSKKGNLNFNYKIALLPPRLADYILVHELCHLGELNHSQKFWNLVAETLPDHRARRRELRKNHVSLA